jgi:type I restriction enzyme S subunit
MKFRKDKWEKVRLGDVCKTTSGGTPSRDRIDFYNGDIPWLKSGELHSKYVYSSEESITELGLKNSSAKLCPINSILIAIYGVTAGTSAILKTEAATNQAVCCIVPFKDKLDYEFLYDVITFKKTDIFKKRVGTYQLNISQAIIRNTEIPLPPLEEQKQIATLFQSLENAIEQVENQEKNLKALQKKLSSSLISTNPIFGNLLTDKNCNLCTFEDITNCVEKNDKKPLENGITRFVGLEFIEAENFNLQGFGEIEKGTTFTKCFLKNDVLFGKRRAYLKKVAVADFDGICSGDILVFRAKKEKMLPELLPYYVSSDAFIQHAVNTSAGSLSPRTKWKDLKEFKISIPDLKTQKKIAEIFQQLQLTLNQLKQQKITLNNLKQKLLSEILG